MLTEKKFFHKGEHCISHQVALLRAVADKSGGRLLTPLWVGAFEIKIIFYIFKS
jgi:hypothetical protein